MGCCQPVPLHLRPEWDGCIPNLQDSPASTGCLSRNFPLAVVPCKPPAVWDKMLYPLAVMPPCLCMV